MNTKEVVLGGGCFWCIEAVYSQTKGVVKAISGYSGGHASRANYEAVCTGTTKHAEVVKVIYDEDVISLDKILDIFWVIHDPTSLNAQGADKGTQYRSVLFYEDPEQKERFAHAIQQASSSFSRPIVTTLEPLEAFYEAEAYHQNYFAKNPTQGYCRAVVAPKVEKFKSAFDTLVK